MRTSRIEDPLAFRRAAEAYLHGNEAKHNLMLGLMETLIDRPEVYREFALWITETAGAVVGAALMTPPFSLVLAEPAVEGAVRSLARQLLADGISVPGVVAALPEIDAFLEAYAPAARLRPGRRQEQAIHVLGALEHVRTPPGRPRRADEDDVELILDWMEAFHDEAMTAVPWDRARTRRNLKHRVPDGSGGGIRIWEDGGPVCLAGFVEVTARAARIGPVYTPPAHRRHGYATALTAHVTREQIARDKALCLLYTDKANPTSNSIYHRIGYRVVCDAAMVVFEEAT